MQKLGKGCCSNLTLSDMASDQHRYQLHGKLFNLGDETGKGSMWDNSIFKTLTDGGTVSVKLLYSQPFEMKNRAKLIMNCNEMPRSSDTTAANYRRMLIIPFDAKFDEDDPQTDPHIDIKMEKELPGIFNRIVTEYKAFLKNGRRFTTSPEIRGELEEYKESNDNVRSWYNETCTLSGDHQSEYSTLNDLYADYTLTSQERNEKPINYNMFCKRVKAIVPSERFKRRAIENKKISIIEGLTFQSQY